MSISLHHGAGLCEFAASQKVEVEAEADKWLRRVRSCGGLASSLVHRGSLKRALLIRALNFILVLGTLAISNYMITLEKAMTLLFNNYEKLLEKRRPGWYFWSCTLLHTCDLESRPQEGAALEVKGFLWSWPRRRKVFLLNLTHHHCPHPSRGWPCTSPLPHSLWLLFVQLSGLESISMSIIFHSPYSSVSLLRFSCYNDLISFHPNVHSTNLFPAIC